MAVCAGYLGRLLARAYPLQRSVLALFGSIAAIVRSRTDSTSRLPHLSLGGLTSAASRNGGSPRPARHLWPRASGGNRMTPKY